MHENENIAPTIFIDENSKQEKLCTAQFPMNISVAENSLGRIFIFLHGNLKCMKNEILMDEIFNFLMHEIFRTSAPSQYMSQYNLCIDPFAGMIAHAKIGWK